MNARVAPQDRASALRMIIRVLSSHATEQGVVALSNAAQIDENTTIDDDTLTECVKRAARAAYPARSAEIEEYRKYRPISELLDRMGF